MKRHFLFFLAVSLLVSCSKDDDKALSSIEKVQFTLAGVSKNISGRAGSTDIPPGTSLVISINNASGDAVFTNRKVTLLKMGDSYMTEPIEFVHGSYSITDFMLVNENDEILFATPRRNSPLASAVSTPLAFSFHINRSTMNNISMQVISTKNRDAKDFGYASFKPEVVYPLMVSVFIHENGKWKLTTATAEVYTIDQEKPQAFELKAKVNTLGLKSIGDGKFTLAIIKEGYSTYVNTFNYEIDTTVPIDIKMEKAPVYFSFFSESVYDAYDFTISVKDGTNLLVDWGDGTIDTVSNASGAMSLSHDYEIMGSSGQASITGDLHKIVSFNKGSHYIDGGEFLHLTGLESLYIDLISSQIDLRNSSHLKSIYIGTGYYELLLPASHNLSNVILSYATYNIDDVIDNIYLNTSDKNITNGTLKLEYVDPVSAESLAKIETLRTDYQWDVSYIERE